MKYFKLWKEPDAEYHEITYGEALATLKTCYNGDLADMLKHEQVIQCTFSTIKVVKED